VIRPAAGAAGIDPVAAPWSLVAAPREALLAELAERRGRFGIEEALLSLAARAGGSMLGGGAWVDVAGELALLYAIAETGTPIAPYALRARVDAAYDRALAERRVRVARELAGWVRPSGHHLIAPIGPAEPPPAAEDPELRDPPPAGGLLFVLHQRDAAGLDLLARHARLGPGAEPVHVAVPFAAGLQLADGLEWLAGELEARSVDLTCCCDIVLLERPLWEAELSWLRERSAMLEECVRLRPAS
jgi:hypothetical protein